MRFKTEVFLHDMVSGEFVAFRTYDTLRAVEELTERLRAETGRDEDFLERYADLVTNTRSLTFNWEPGVPEEFEALEVLWKMRQQHVPEAECVTFCASSLSTVAIAEWSRALVRALRIWTPLDSRPEAQLTAEEAKDPK